MKASEKQVMGCGGCIVMGVCLPFIGICLLVVMGQFAAESGSSSPAASTSTSSVENSSWDGSVHQVRSFLKKNLKDPKSYESISWSPVRKENDHYVVTHTYRAKNSFGGYAIETGTFYVSLDGDFVMTEEAYKDFMAQLDSEVEARREIERHLGPAPGSHSASHGQGGPPIFTSPPPSIPAPLAEPVPQPIAVPDIKEPPPDPNLREWTNAAGQKLTATCARWDAKTITLRQGDSEKAYPWSAFSAEDLKWIAAHPELMK